MKYQVKTSALTEYIYTVNAKSKKEAEEKFWDGEWNDCEEVGSPDIDAQEEVIFIEKV